jgi:hypothetical protein
LPSNRRSYANEASSKRSTASLSSNRLKNKTWNSDSWEFSKGRRWSEPVAVGSVAFAEKGKSELGVKTMHREIAQAGGTYALREPGEAYRGEFDSESDALRAENTLPWQRIAETAET